MAYIPGLGTFRGEKLTVNGVGTPHSPFGGKGGAIPRDTINEFGTHFGVASGRPFFPEETGLSISTRQLTTNGVRITKQGVEKVERHLARFGFDTQNEAQIQRLKAIADGTLTPTQADLNHYTHELRESLRYQKLGYQTGQPNNPIYNIDYGTTYIQQLLKTTVLKRDMEYFTILIPTHYEDK